jgi:outer membrane protein OmpA-like peptidoglycan-associated protein/ABC-type amino acid transport substrate-binding protein
MTTHVKVFVALLVVGLVGILGAKFALPLLRDALERQTSDAAATHGTLRVAVDSWVGYFPLCSPEMAKRMRAAGYNLRCEDDKADYAERFRRLKDGGIDFAVATVDSYVLNGAREDYPGVIVAVLDESKGGDAIVGRRSIVASLEDLKRQPNPRVAYTPASPSEHLLKAIASHFDVRSLKPGGGAQRIAADGSSDALAKLKAGAADVAVLWEPDVSRALADADIAKLLGTEDTDKLIVDVLLGSRKLLQDKPDAVQAVLDQYFQALKHYQDNPAQLREEVEDATDLSGDQVDAMLQGVAWATLNDNGAQWFGVTPSGLPGDEGLIDAVSASIAILVSAGDFKGNPLPDQDAYRITNRQFVSSLYLAQGGAAAAPGGAQSLAREFKPLDDKGWAQLRPVGSLKVEPIGFARGTSSLDEEGRATLDRVAERLRHYPNYRILIKGHTGTGGDAQANVELSKQRAQAVAEYMLTTWQVNVHRIHALGYGGSQPLPREAGESDRAWAYRLPRVDVVLVSER